MVEGDGVGVYSYAYVCDLCSMCYSSSGALAFHKKSVHEHIRYPCNYDFCDRSYTRRGGLKKHVETVHLKLMHACVLCHKTYKSLALLKAHLCPFNNSNSDVEQYGCNICSDTFRYKRTLTQHINKIHRRRQWQHLCEFCGILYTSKSGLEAHIREIHLKIRFFCEDCGRQYTQIRSLNRHMITCSQHLCLTCNTHFQDANTFNQHVCQANLIQYPYHNELLSLSLSEEEQELMLSL